MDNQIAITPTKPVKLVPVEWPTGVPDHLTDEMIEYLRYESQRRGISLEEAYREEMAYQRQAEKTRLDPETLERFAAASQPPAWERTVAVADWVESIRVDDVCEVEGVVPGRTLVAIQDKIRELAARQSEDK